MILHTRHDLVTTSYVSEVTSGSTANSNLLQSHPLLPPPPPPPSPIPTTSQDLCCVPGLCQWQPTQTCYNPTLCSTPTYRHRIYVEFQGFVDGSQLKPATIPPLSPSPPPSPPNLPSQDLCGVPGLCRWQPTQTCYNPPLYPPPPPPPTYLHRIYVEFQGFVDGSQLKPATIPSSAPNNPTPTYRHRIYVEFQGFENGSQHKPATIPPFNPPPPHLTPTYLHRIHVEFQGFVDGSQDKLVALAARDKLKLGRHKRVQADVNLVQPHFSQCRQLACQCDAIGGDADVLQALRSQRVQTL